MASFISTLSLFLLVLVSGYFTLPLNHEQLATSTMLSFNVDHTSERPLVPRELFPSYHSNELLSKHVQQTTDSSMKLQMTTSADNLLESASRGSYLLNKLTTLSPLMLTTDKSKADKRGLNDLSLTTVESTTADDSDNDAYTEDNATMDNESESKNDKREVLPELTTNTLPLTSTSSDAASGLNSEFTTQKSSSSKPSKQFTGLLKDKKDREQDLEQGKEKDDEEKKPVKPSKTYKKENEDDEEKKPVKPSKTYKKENEDDEEKKPVKPSKAYKKENEDDEGKKPVKPSKAYKKENEDDEEKKPVKPSKAYKKENEDDEEKKPVKPSKTYKKENEDDKTQSGEDSKKEVAPTAQLDSDVMKNVSNYPKEYMDLDENNSLTVTQSGSTDSTTTLKYKKGKKSLNQGEESSTAEKEESNN